MSATVNKSQLIRDLLAIQPNESTAGIVKALKKYKVSAGLVYLVRSQMKGSTPASSAPKKVNGRQVIVVNRDGTAATVKSVGQFKPNVNKLADLLRKIKALSEEVGGVKTLRDILTAITEGDWTP